MFRLWGKLMKNNKFQGDIVIQNDDSSLSLEEKVTLSLDEICYEFDLQRPMWFDKNTKELEQFMRTSFYADQFIESIQFDYLEIEIIEKDKA